MKFKERAKERERRIGVFVLKMGSVTGSLCHYVIMR